MKIDEVTDIFFSFTRLLNPTSQYITSAKFLFFVHNLRLPLVHVFELKLRKQD